MKELKITIDKRCCIKNEILIDDFKIKIQNNFPKYQINFLYTESPQDSFCKNGYTSIKFINTTEDQQKHIIDTLNNIYISFLKLSSSD